MRKSKSLLEEQRRLKELDRKQDAEIEELAEEQRRLKELDRKQDAELEELNSELDAMLAKVSAWPDINREQNEETRSRNGDIRPAACQAAQVGHHQSKTRRAP